MFEWLGEEVHKLVWEAAKHSVDLAVENTIDEAKQRVHVDTGALRASIEKKEVISTQDEYSVSLGSELDYALIQEMKFPYLRPSAEIHANGMKVELE